MMRRGQAGQPSNKIDGSGRQQACHHEGASLGWTPRLTYACIRIPQVRSGAQSVNAASPSTPLDKARAFAGCIGDAIGEGEPRKAGDLDADGPQGESGIRQQRDQRIDMIDRGLPMTEGAAACVVDGHSQAPQGDDRRTLTVARRALERLRTTRCEVHSDAADKAGPGRIVNRNEPGTPAHAFTAAVNALGAKTVQAITGMGRSSVYAATNIHDPRGLSGLTYEKALMLAGAMAAQGARGDLFALPFLRMMKAIPAPSIHSGNLLHQTVHLGALYGRTAEALCRMFDRAEGQRGPVPIDPRDRDAALIAIDAQIAGLTAMRDLLLTTTAMPPLVPTFGTGAPPGDPT